MSGPAETIAAVATPPGRGGIGIVRVSGVAVPRIAERVLGSLPAPRVACYQGFRDAGGRVIDRGLALYFPAPASFTGEDVLELHGHGGPVVMDMLLDAVVAAGARPARAGEFTQRAFLNDRLDLAQAEAVADLIDSATREAARSALRSLEGALSARVSALVEELVALRTHVEAAMDFPEEEIDFLADATLAARLEALRVALETVRREAAHGASLREGVRVVLAGAPNVGKSSLLNALAGRDAAIVTEVAGTTRDLVREQIEIDGLPLHVIDTAGLRETCDAVEREGVSRARAAIAAADAVLLMVDDRTGPGPAEEAMIAELSTSPEVILVRNKIDLSGAPPGVGEHRGRREIRLSALTGAGLDSLRADLKACVGYVAAGEGLFMARRRHLVALDETAGALDEAARALAEQRAGELAAEELRAAQRALGEITGEFTSDDLLGRIFSSFCIGK